MSKKGSVFGETRIHIPKNPGFWWFCKEGDGSKSTNTHGMVPNEKILVQGCYFVASCRPIYLPKCRKSKLQMSVMWMTVLFNYRIVRFLNIPLMTVTMLEHI